MPGHNQNGFEARAQIGRVNPKTSANFRKNRQKAALNQSGIDKTRLNSKILIYLNGKFSTVSTAKGIC